MYKKIILISIFFFFTSSSISADFTCRNKGFGVVDCNDNRPKSSLKDYGNMFQPYEGKSVAEYAAMYDEQRRQRELRERQYSLEARNIRRTRTIKPPWNN